MSGDQRQGAGLVLGECTDRRLIRSRAREARTLAGGEIESESHRVRHGQDVGKQDGGIERISIERL